jgi:hypothetical protein
MAAIGAILGIETIQSCLEGGATMRKRDWLLIALGEGSAPIQIQKTLFKFAMESGAPPLELYEFVPYNWGPCSFDIYGDLEALRTLGLVHFEPSGLGWSDYRITEKGVQAVSQLKKQADSKLLERMDAIRAWVAERAFDELLHDVYAQYPAFAERSLFRK